MSALRIVPGDRQTIELPPPGDPMAVGRRLVKVRYLAPDSGEHALRHWRGGWWQWMGPQWVEREERAVRRDAYDFTELAAFIDDKKKLKPWQPTRFKVGNLLEAVAAIVHLDGTTDQPAWIDGFDGPRVVATMNGLLDLDGRILRSHSPAYFNQTAVPFDYDAAASPPAAWLGFLEELWPDDPASIAALQEFFGYVISGRLDLHKILLIVGPTRGGKGTIARVLGKMIGAANVAGPTLASLSGDFGMAPLIGKSLAVISDARLSQKRDSSVVVERLLAISGEDTITVNRKYRDQWTGKLPCRFLVISNELPQLGDDSGTIANRFVVLLLRESWLGREDLGLEDRLTAELTGILNWSLDGLDRLVAQNRFTRPASTDDAIQALQDLASPTAAFVRDRCVTGPLHEVVVDDIYKAWKEWAASNDLKPGSKQTFGRNLRSVVPGLRVARPRDGDDRVRIYQGIGLRDDSTDHNAADRGPSRTTAPESPSGPQWSAVHTTVGGTQDDLGLEHEDRDPTDPAEGGPDPGAGDAQPCPTCGHPMVVAPGGHPVCTNAPGHPRKPHAEAPLTPINCSAYSAHQSHHHWVSDRFVCDICEAASSEVEGGQA